MFPTESAEDVAAPLNYPTDLREHHTRLLRELASEAHAAWERSCEEQRRVRITRGRTVRGRGGEHVPLPDLEVIEILPGKGDPRYLVQARAALADIRKLWGGEKPPAPAPAPVDAAETIEAKREQQEPAPGQVVTGASAGCEAAPNHPELLSVPEAAVKASEPAAEEAPPDAGRSDAAAPLAAAPPAFDDPMPEASAGPAAEQLLHRAERSPPQILKPKCQHPQCHLAYHQRSLTDV